MDAARAGSDVRESRTRRGGPPTLTPEVRALVTRVLGTVTHLDVLLALRRDAPRPCSPDELARSMDVPYGLVVRRCADDLVDAGLVSSPGGASTYWYAPSTPALRQAVDALAGLYAARRRLVLRALYLHPSVSFVTAAVAPWPAAGRDARATQGVARGPRSQNASGVTS